MVNQLIFLLLINLIFYNSYNFLNNNLNLILIILHLIINNLLIQLEIKYQDFILLNIIINKNIFHYLINL